MTQARAFVVVTYTLEEGATGVVAIFFVRKARGVQFTEGAILSLSQNGKQVYLTYLIFPHLEPDTAREVVWLSYLRPPFSIISSPASSALPTFSLVGVPSSLGIMTLKSRKLPGTTYATVWKGSPPRDGPTSLAFK